MKKSLTTFIMLLFLFNIFGFYIPYLVKRSVIRSEMRSMKKSIPENLITKLSFDMGTGAAPDWVREGKEFRHNNEMYDVIRSEVINGTIIYYCIKDKDEKELESTFQKMLKKHQDTEGKTKNNSLKELSKYFPTAKIEIPSAQKNDDFSSAHINFYKSLNKEILSPPPKFA